MSFGFPATLIHGDTLVLDRWLWISRHLTSVRAGSKRLLDVGCGSGAFTIGLALLGYKALGLSWDERNQSQGRRETLSRVHGKEFYGSAFVGTGCLLYVWKGMILVVQKSAGRLKVN
jgi:SAM-dependent methyltransferase